MSKIECAQLHNELFRRRHSTRQSHGLFALAKHLSTNYAFDCVQCGCFGRLKMEELGAAKHTELTHLLENCYRLENELASVRKVRILLVLLQVLMIE